MRAEREGVVLRVTVSGPLTLSGSNRLRRFIKEQLEAEPEIRSVITDMRGVVYMYSPADRVVLSKATVASPDRVNHPMVYLMSAVDEAAQSEHCAEIAEHGIFRMVTTEPDAAKDLARLAATWLWPWLSPVAGTAARAPSVDRLRP